MIGTEGALLSIMFNKCLVASSDDPNIISTRAKKRPSGGRGVVAKPRLFGARHLSSFGIVEFNTNIAESRHFLTTAILTRQRTGQIWSSLGASTADSISIILSFLSDVC